LSTRTAIVLLVAALLAPGAGADDPPSPPTTSLGTTYDGELLRDLPGGRRGWSAFETADVTAILDVIDNGGLYTGEAEHMGVHGASWTQVSYRLGDLDITDPDATGTPLFLPDPGLFEAFDLVSGSMPADLGGPGSVVTLVPRLPGDAWHGMASGHLLGGGRQDLDPAQAPPVARYDSFGGGRFRLDGPLVKDRLGLLVAASATRVRRMELASETPLAGSESSLLSHLVWRPLNGDEVRALAAVQEVTRPQAGRARFGDVDVSERARFVNVQAAWSRRGPTPWTVTAGYARGAFLPEDAGVSTTAVERLLSGPIPLLYAGDSRRHRAALGASTEPWAGRRLGRRHALRVGLSWTETGSTTRPSGPRGLTAESVDGLPARVWDYGWAGPVARWRGFEAALFVQDRARYGRLTLDAGLRLEHSGGSAESVPGTISWNALSPRLAAWIDLIPRHVAFRAGYARYRGRLPLSLLAYGDPAGPEGAVHRWRDDGDGIPEAGEQGPLIARVGPGGEVASIAPNLRAPSTEEVVLGLEAHFARTWTFRFIGIHRRERDLVASIDEGAGESAYRTTTVADPGGDLAGTDDDQLLPVFDRRPETFGQDRYVLANTEENALHEGVEATMQGRIGPLRIFFGGTASKSEGPNASRGFRVTENDQGVLGERREDPNATTAARGRLFFDRAYTLNFGGTWRAPGDARLGLVARYQDGQPFSRLVIAPGLNQGPEAVQSVPNGRHRFTYTLTVDARVEKGVRVGRLRLAPALEVFNVLNMHNEMEEDVTTGASFRTVTAVQPPRAAILELRADF
jgi:hypothetical protein